MMLDTLAMHANSIMDQMHACKSVKHLRMNLESFGNKGLDGEVVHRGKEELYGSSKV